MSRSADFPVPPASPVVSSAATSATSLNDVPVDLSRMLYMLYLDLEQQISRADFKAQITLGTSTLLAALAVNLGLGFATPGIERFVGLEWIALTFYSLCALSICGAIGFAVVAVYPRSAGRSKTLPADPNLYFSVDIIRLDPADYVARFLSQDHQQLKESVVRQIQLKSRVLDAKLAAVRRGLVALVASVVFWAVGHATLLVAYGKLIGR